MDARGKTPRLKGSFASEALPPTFWKSKGRVGSEKVGENVATHAMLGGTRQQRRGHVVREVR